MKVDPADIENGGIYRIRHRHIRFPENLWRKDPHPFRTVIAISGNFVCQSPDCDVVSVAPMSSDLDLFHPTDLIVRRSPENGLNKDGRILLGHIQPVRKDAFEVRYGRVSDDEWREIILKVIDNFDN